MKYLLLGGSGVLGTGFREVLRRRGEVATRLSPDWRDAASLAGYFQTVLPALLDHEQQTVLVWAAGVGSIGASPEVLRTETDAVRTLCRTLHTLPAERAERVRVLFASSAGALYGGHGAAPVGEHDVPTPVSSYGRAKLEQERLLHETAERTGCQVVLCRLSNVYGVADGRLTTRGLVSTAVRATPLRQPMTVFVSPDPQRDYVYSADAAALSPPLLETAPPGCSHALVRDGRTRPVSSVLSLVGAVSARRVRPATRSDPRRGCSQRRCASCPALSALLLSAATMLSSRGS